MNNPVEILLHNGGVAAWFILLSGVIMIVVAFERVSFLYFKYSLRATEAMAKIRAAVLKRDYTSAIQVCNTSTEAPELNVVKAGLIAAEHGREAMRSALGGAVLDVTHKVEKHIPLLALIAGVSTLLGLLGTISGLIKTFGAIAMADPSKKGELLGLGISEAMYATAGGLIVGVIAMVFHTICSTKADDIVGSSQGAGYQLITWIEESERSQSNG